MSDQPQHYTLQLLFDSSQITLETLQERIAGALDAHKPNIELTITTTKSGHLLVSLQGALEVVDTCHDKINKLTTASPPLTFIRLIDEAGDAVRQMAYAILSRIEQDFRVFIHRVAIENYGLGWWETVISGRLHTRTQDVANKNKAAVPYLHRLELTQFEDLVEIIDSKTSEWPEDRPLSVSDLLGLLADCTSIAEAQAKLAKKVQKVSLWDRVSVHYFTDKQQWEAVKKSIDFVIRERHKVMHHRPIRLGVVEALRKKQQEIQGLLEATKDVLSAQERAEIQQEVGEQLPKQVEQVRRQQEIRSSLDLISGMGEAIRSAQSAIPSSSTLDLISGMGEAIRSAQSAIPSSSTLDLISGMGEAIRSAQKATRQRPSRRTKQGADAAAPASAEPPSDQSLETEPDSKPDPGE